MYAIMIIDDIETQPLIFPPDNEELAELEEELNAYRAIEPVDDEDARELDWLISMTNQQIIKVKARRN